MTDKLDYDYVKTSNVIAREAAGGKPPRPPKKAAATKAAPVAKRTASADGK